MPRNTERKDGRGLGLVVEGFPEDLSFKLEFHVGGRRRTGCLAGTREESAELWLHPRPSQRAPASSWALTRTHSTGRTVEAQQVRSLQAGPELP